MRNDGLEILAFTGHTEVKRNRRKQYISFLTRFCKWLVEHVLEVDDKKKYYELQKTENCGEPSPFSS